MWRQEGRKFPSSFLIWSLFIFLLQQKQRTSQQKESQPKKKKVCLPTGDPRVLLRPPLTSLSLSDGFSDSNLPRNRAMRQSLFILCFFSSNQAVTQSLFLFVVFFFLIFLFCFFFSTNQKVWKMSNEDIYSVIKLMAILPLYVPIVLVNLAYERVMRHTSHSKGNPKGKEGVGGNPIKKRNKKQKTNVDPFLCL